VGQLGFIAGRPAPGVFGLEGQGDGASHPLRGVSVSFHLDQTQKTDGIGLSLARSVWGLEKLRRFAIIVKRAAVTSNRFRPTWTFRR